MGGILNNMEVGRAVDVLESIEAKVGAQLLAEADPKQGALIFTKMEVTYATNILAAMEHKAGADVLVHTGYKVTNSRMA